MTQDTCLKFVLQVFVVVVVVVVVIVVVVVGNIRFLLLILFMQKGVHFFVEKTQYIHLKFSMTCIIDCIQFSRKKNYIVYLYVYIYIYIYIYIYMYIHPHTSI